MTAVPFWHVDAFAAAPFTGNPAAVVLLERWPQDWLLQSIAAELNLPATAFAVAAGGQTDFELRCFSPRAEIALCGHGSLASGHVLIHDRAAVCFATPDAGTVSVARADAGYSLSLPAIAAQHHPLPDSVAALGGHTVETLWNPRGYAILVYADDAAVRALQPDRDALARLGPLQHSATAPGIDSDIVSRVFNREGEDAVTGSAHAIVAPFWAERLGRSDLSAVQASPRGGRLRCQVEGDRVVLTGRCVTIAQGTLRI